MGRAKVVAPPPKDYVPEPLVAPPIEEIVEEVIVEEVSEISIQISDTVEESSPEELERERIAQEKHEEIIRQKAAAEKEAKRQARLAKRAAKKDPELLAEVEALRQANEQLAKDKEAAEKAREETILAMRNKATEERGNQLNIVKQRKPSLWNRFKDFFRRRRIELATVGIKNYETAILQRARIAVPKMLDDLEKMHEQLTILEELIAKYVERQKIKD